MTLEESLKALKAAFTSKSGEAEAFAKEIGELKAKVETLSAEKVALAERLEESVGLIAERDSAVAKVEELTKALAASESLKAEATKQIETVGKVAAKIVASVGVQPVEISAADGAAAKSPEEVWTEYCGIKDASAKLAFYNKNRAAILAHMGIK